MSKQRNIKLPRRNFKKKVIVVKEFAYLKPGDVLTSVTMVKGNYSGIYKNGKILHIPVGYAKELE